MHLVATPIHSQPYVLWYTVSQRNQHIRLNVLGAYSCPKSHLANGDFFEVGQNNNLEENDGVSCLILTLVV